MQFRDRQQARHAHCQITADGELRVTDDHAGGVLPTVIRRINMGRDRSSRPHTGGPITKGPLITEESVIHRIRRAHVEHIRISCQDDELVADDQFAVRNHWRGQDDRRGERHNRGKSRREVGPAGGDCDRTGGIGIAIVPTRKAPVLVSRGSNLDIGSNRIRSGATHRPALRRIGANADCSRLLHKRRGVGNIRRRHRDGVRTLHTTIAPAAKGPAIVGGRGDLDVGPHRIGAAAGHRAPIDRAGNGANCHCGHCGNFASPRRRDGAGPAGRVTVDRHGPVVGRDRDRRKGHCHIACTAGCDRSAERATESTRIRDVRYRQRRIAAIGDRQRRARRRPGGHRAKRQIPAHPNHRRHTPARCVKTQPRPRQNQIPQQRASPTARLQFVQLQHHLAARRQIAHHTIHGRIEVTKAGPGSLQILLGPTAGQTGIDHRSAPTVRGTRGHIQRTVVAGVQRDDRRARPTQ